ncbi:MAG TPA: hypothetical protein PK771_08805, partial [Spirochaetota bacterium]|nr:hypothetical protein [Spirochaetota bacterium]
MRRLVYIFLVISIIFGCKSLQKNKPDGSWDFEKFMVEAKRFANNGKYQSAIDILRDSIVKFPNEDVIPI